jgi:probable phosphoglycerate mutase
VRHGAHALLSHTLAGRMPGVPLNAVGRQQATALAARLAGQAAAAVVSSPVQRAAETAAPVAERLGLPVTLDPAFEEVDFGRWTGLGFDALDADPAWHDWNRLRSLAACPGGETMHAVQSRALDGLRRLRGRYPDQGVLLFTHSDIIKVLLSPALGLPLDRLYRLTIDPASISTLVVFDGDVRVDGVNR